MLFNSYLFLFVFFPTALTAYFMLSRFGERPRLAAILVASFVFYAAWDVRFLALLSASILSNYLIGLLLSRAVEDIQVSRSNVLLAFGVGLDLLTLGIFKYAHFFVANFNALSGDNIVLGRIVLPLGISFFTFEQIGYLVDLRRGSDYRSGILRYAVFVSFFPRLVAGPILRYSEIGLQLADAKANERSWENIAVGLTIFFIGLAKKTILADGIGTYVGPLFGSAASGAHPDFFLAWAAALAYTCQLYFDFSGYSDMAIGAARCFGIRFPMNFNSPYKSVSITEFWRRWHMTLSRFLRDYLYVPLGGNRRGKVRRYVNLLITMLLGGLWHGANWTFVAWGGLHGLYLVLNHAWQTLCGRAAHQSTRFGRLCGLTITFLAVVVGWVFFRAPTFATALNVLEGMAGFHGAALPQAFLGLLEPVRPILHVFGIGFVYADGRKTLLMWCWILVLLTIAFFSPNTQEIMAGFDPVLGNVRAEGDTSTSPLLWRPTFRWSVAVGSITFLAVISITRVSEFLYWQF